MYLQTWNTKMQRYSFLSWYYDRKTECMGHKISEWSKEKSEGWVDALLTSKDESQMWECSHLDIPNARDIVPRQG